MASPASDRPMAAIRAVTVVPTLAPSIKGKSFLGEIFSVAASMTLKDVVTVDE